MQVEMAMGILKAEMAGDLEEKVLFKLQGERQVYINK